MKTLVSSLVVAGLLVFTGCNTSPTGGGNPSSTGPQGKSTTFTLHGPEKLTAHTVKHKESHEFKVTVDKGKDFKETLSFSATVEPADKGVTATPEPKELKASDPAEVKVKVEVGDKAGAGEYKVTLTARPAVGQPTAVDWKVKVPEPK
jgi:hypothetical protein